MKNIQIILLVCLSLFLFNSCSESSIFFERQEITDYVWAHGETLEFEFDFKQENSKAEIILMLRHASFYETDHLAFNFTETTPSDQRTTKIYRIPLKDKEGLWKSKCAGDHCDIEVYLKDEYLFQEGGTYKYQVECLMPNYDKINGVMSIALLIRNLE